jgi:hypothetical protein
VKPSETNAGPPSSVNARDEGIGPHNLPPGRMDWPEPPIRDTGPGDAPAPRSPAPARTVALLALVASAKQTAFCHHARDAASSDRVVVRVTMADIASQEQRRCQIARERLAGLGVEPLVEMTPYLRDLTGFDRGLATDLWWERILGSYLAHGIAVDAQRLFAARLDPGSEGLLEGLLDDCAGADYLRAILLNAVRADSRRASRLSLWGRRVAGDALGEVTGIVGRVPALAGVAAGDTAAAVASLHAQLAQGHSRRMDGRGLTP